MQTIINNLLESINEQSKRHFDIWLKGKHIVDVIKDENKYMVVFIEDEVYNVDELISKNDDRLPCFFGTLGDYIRNLAEEMVIENHGMESDKYQYERRLEKEFTRKYSLPPDYFWKSYS